MIDFIELFQQKLSISSKDGTKSSWIKSLKRSLTRRRKRDTTSSSLVISDNDVSNNINSERLNKSDWDIRNGEDDQISVEGNSLNIGRLSISSGLNAEGMVCIIFYFFLFEVHFKQ